MDRPISAPGPRILQRDRDRDVILAHVDPVGTARKRQIRAVVEDERNSERPAYRQHLDGAPEQQAVVEALLPELHHIHSAPNAG